MELDLSAINRAFAKLDPSAGEIPNVAPAHRPANPRLQSIEEMVQKSMAQQESPTQSQPLPTPHTSSPSHKQEVEELKQKHFMELEEWREYEKRIHAWKMQVQEIFENMKKELANKNEVIAELSKTKALLATKDRELEMIKLSIESREGKDALSRITRG